ncbi:WD40 repeat-like protein [Gyrodon lividus]|nr:WD40 repeat-like protein [Gyrodon lividus]
MSSTSKKSVDIALEPLLTMSGHDGTIFGLAYLPSGERLVTCSADNTVRMWNVENGEQEGTSMEHDGGRDALAVARDGKKIVSAGEGNRMRVWDIETHKVVEEWTGYENLVRYIAMSPDGELVASGHGHGGIVIREMDGGTVKHSLQSGSGDVNSVCFSPNGQKLVSGHDDAAIRVFDVQSGDLILGPIKGHAKHVYSVVWSLDGSRLFTASWDVTIRCWDSETGEAIGEPWAGHTDYINSLSLSPDGTKLASASTDKTVRFWATDSGDPIGEPLQHEGAVWAVAFSPSGEFVACSGRDRKASIWRVPWWDVSQREAHRSLLDLPAVTVPPGHIHHTIAGHDRQLDFLDLPTNRHPSSPRTRLRTSHTTGDPSRTQSPTFSWSLWREIPRILFGRSHELPRHAEVTTVYSGFAGDRIYVASRDNEPTTETLPEPMPTAPGHYGGFSIVVESVSSSDSLDDDQATPAPADNSEHVQVSCCGLFSRRRGRSGSTSAPPAIELAERAALTSNTPPPVVASSHPSMQHALDLPAC